MTDIEIMNTDITNSGDASANKATATSESETRTPRAMYGVVNLIGRTSEGGGEVFNDYVNNAAYSEFTTATGYDNEAGSNAYKVIGINHTTKALVLNKAEGLSVGTVCSLQFNIALKDGVSGANYDYFGTIKSVNNNNKTITFEDWNIPNTELINENTTDYETILWVPSNPNLGDGVTKIGIGAFSTGQGNKASQIGSFASGYNNEAAGKCSAVFGNTNKVGYCSLAAGKGNKVNQFNFVSGNNNEIVSNFSLISGETNKITGNHSVIFGKQNVIQGSHSFAFGANNQITGDRGCFVGGENSQATGSRSFSFGTNTKAEGVSSIAMGLQTEGLKDGAVAIGWGAKAEEVRSFALGANVTANKEGQFVCGKFNQDNDNAIFIVGNGYSNGSGKLPTKQNAFWVNSDGSVQISNDANEILPQINKQTLTLYGPEQLNIAGIFGYTLAINKELLPSHTNKEIWLKFSYTDGEALASMVDISCVKIAGKETAQAVLISKGQVGDKEAIIKFIIPDGIHNITNIIFDPYCFVNDDELGNFSAKDFKIEQIVQKILPIIDSNYLATTGWVDKYISKIIDTTGTAASPSAGVNFNNINELAKAVNLIWNGNKGTDAKNETIKYVYYDSDGEVQESEGIPIAAGFEGISSIYTNIINGTNGTTIWENLKDYAPFQTQIKDWIKIPNGQVTIAKNTALNETYALRIKNESNTVASIWFKHDGTAAFGGQVNLNDGVRVQGNALFTGPTTFEQTVNFNNGITFNETALNSIKTNLRLRKNFFNSTKSNHNGGKPLGKGNTFNVKHSEFRSYSVFEIQFDDLVQVCLASYTTDNTDQKTPYHIRGIGGGINDSNKDKVKRVCHIIVDFQYIPPTSGDIGTLKVLESFAYYPYKFAGENKLSISKDGNGNLTKYTKGITRIYGIA